MFISEAEYQQFQTNLETKNEATCPCCQRRARVNRLKIHSTLALMLGRLYWRQKQLAEDLSVPVHIEQIRPAKHASGRDFCIVKHWGLAEPLKAEKGEDKHSSGLWGLTPLGAEFIAGGGLIPKYVFVMDNKVVSKSLELTSLQQALNNKFSFTELMEHFGKL